MEIIENKIKELKARLKPYQWSSVEAICNRFEEHDRVLLADEVGLGKTEITKGVIAKMAEKHHSNQGEKPFRVAYICPNQNVAKQNYPKLQIFPFGINKNEGIKSKLEEALDTYKTCENKKGVKEKNDSDSLQKDYLKNSSVYTRVCEWLIGTYGGEHLEKVVVDEIKNIYGFPNAMSGTNSNTESKSAKNRPQMSKGVREQASELIGSVLNVLENGDPLTHQMLQSFWDSAIAIASASGKSKSEILPKIFYDFNKKVAGYLIEAVEEDYRLSMQHLYRAESTFFSVGKVMQLESLTPSTSLKLGNSNGTYYERALIYATLKSLFEDDEEGNPIKQEKVELDLKTDRNCNVIEGYPEKCEEYKARLEKYRFKDDKLKKTLSTSSKSLTVPDLRNIFIEHNISMMQYDLIIMDEFQNFADLVAKESTTEAEKLVKVLFEKENTKILLLSATPFEIANTIFEEIDTDIEQTETDNRKISENHIDDFYKLYKFLNPQDKDFEENWKNAIQNGVTSCEELLYQGGIFRTERISATKINPVVGKSKEVKFDFNYAIKANKFMSGMCVTNNYRTDYSISTPYALSFVNSYTLLTDSDQNKVSISGSGCSGYEDLFLSKAQLKGTVEIKTTSNAYEALKGDIFEKKPELLLWVPPAKHSGGLKGVFKGMEGFSKTLIFAHYRMTPMAFTYLLTNKANVGLGVGESEEGLIEKGEIREIIDEVSQKPQDATKATKAKDALAEYFETIFNTPIGKRAVLKNWEKMKSAEEKAEYKDKGKEYKYKVKEYCECGCFGDMISEYIELLENEYGSNDFAMASAIKKITKLKVSEPNLIYSEDEKIKSEQIKAPNLFAVGLFSDKANGDTEKRLGNIKGAFNSPFWPFVFTTTSIGAEGIDLHWYARNVVHWSVPKRPIDLEQREGRVLRYQCHAVRLNNALIEADDSNSIKKEQCLKADWIKSELYECQLNFFAKEEKDGGKDGCYHVMRKTYFYKYSTQLLKYQRAQRMVSIYRELIGRDVDLNKRIDDDAELTEGEVMCLAPFYHSRNRTRLK